MNCPAAPSSPRLTLVPPPRPAILFIEGWEATRNLLPQIAQTALPGVDILAVCDLDEASLALRAHGPRICGFVTNGLVHGGKTPQDTLALVDGALGKAVPFVVFTGMVNPPAPHDFKRTPLAVMTKPSSNLRDCLKPFEPYVRHDA